MGTILGFTLAGCAGNDEIRVLQESNLQSPVGAKLHLQGFREAWLQPTP